MEIITDIGLGPYGLVIAYALLFIIAIIEVK